MIVSPDDATVRPHVGRRELLFHTSTTSVVFNSQSVAASKLRAQDLLHTCDVGAYAVISSAGGVRHVQSAIDASAGVAGDWNRWGYYRPTGCLVEGGSLCPSSRRVHTGLELWTGTRPTHW